MGQNFKIAYEKKVIAIRYFLTRKFINDELLFQGGKFYFYEHIAEFDLERHGIRRKMQGLLSVTGIWPFIFDGCQLNRDMLQDLQEAGFSKVEAQRFYGPFDGPVFQLVKPSLRGVAEKQSLHYRLCVWHRNRREISIIPTIQLEFKLFSLHQSPDTIPHLM